MNRKVFAGLLLIVAGALALAAQYVEIADGAILVALGAILLVAYAVKRVYGYLIAGAILPALGVSAWVNEVNGGETTNGGLPLVALAVAFAAIYVIDALTVTPSRWWPIVPAAILGFLGASLWMERPDPIEQFAAWWPLGLIAIGLFVLLRISRTGTA